VALTWGKGHGELEREILKLRERIDKIEEEPITITITQKEE